MNPEQRQREPEREQPAPWTRKEQSPFDGPKSPNSEKPDTDAILKKLRTVDPKQTKRYRQRSGQGL
jgi:hypothetical protein